ncbi:MAG: ABC transporter transmembrane domain-containing protein [Candidatus Paceibacterota bacterium]
MLFIALGSVLGSVILPTIYQKIIDNIISESQLTFSPDLKNTFIMLAIVLVSGSVSWRIAGRINLKIESRIIKRLSDLSFTKIFNHSRRFFANNPVGELFQKTEGLLVHLGRL